MGLVLLGAAAGADPLAEWVFKSRPLLILGELSYVQYLMQRVIWNFLRQHFPKYDIRMVYPFVLIVFCFCCQRWAEVPYTEWQKMRIKNGETGFVEDLISWLDSRITATPGRRLALSLLVV